MLYYTANLILDTSVHMKNSLKDVQKGAMLIPKERDMYGIGLPTKDASGPVNPSHLEIMATLVELQQPNLLPLLQDVHEKIRDRTAKAVQQNYKIN